MNVSWENFYQEGELNSDITTYQKAIEINPNSSPSHYHLASILQKQGKLEEVIALFREAIEKNPKFSWNYYLLGEALAKKNQLREAASCYKKALALNPEKYQFYQAALDGLRQNLEKTNLDDESNSHKIFDLSNNIYFDENELKSLLKHWSSDLVIFTVLTQEYIKVGENWIVAIEKLDINNYIVLALDEETYSFCHIRKVPSILIKPPVPLEYDSHTKSKSHSDKYAFLLCVRLQVAIYILKLGFKALNSDADAVWLKNPLPYISGINSSVVFQPASFPKDVKMNYGFTCCMGFIQFSPEPGVESLLSKVNSNLIEHFSDSDQRAFNQTLADCYSISWEKQISKWEHTCIENGWNDPIHGKCIKSGLTFTALPHSLFQRHNTTVDNVKHAIICHPNSPKEQEAKFEVFNELGLNFLNRNTAKVPLKKPYKHIVDNNKPISLKMKNEYDFIQYVEKGIIHVGANTGQESEIYGDDYNVLWIEPIEEVFKTLCNNVKRFHKHLCLCYLISEKDKQEFSFYIANQTVRSSMYEFTDHHYNDPQFKYQEAVQIKARRLDKLIEEGIIDINLYDVLVTDCQGGDYEVIVSLGENIKELRRRLRGNCKFRGKHKRV